MATKKTASYQELLAQKEALEQQMQEAKAAEVAGVVAEIREKIALYGLTPEEVFGRPRGARGPSKGTKATPKYRDPESGATWTGRGKPPLWIAGKERETFLIQ